ncbi:MAG: RNA polymerase sigma factor RpoH [Pseudomonadales bacterium]|nr:RNA polymerase sigma factor RpoH [Pseudomonadales bacterium]
MATHLQPIDATSPGSNLESYLQSVNSIPLLDAVRERELAEKLYYDGDLDAARQLVMSHLRFVVYIARSYSGYGLAEADLIQEGNVGLMKAVKRFNPEYGVRLVSFAVHWIKAEIHEFILRNWRIVKVATTKAQRKLFFNLRGATGRLGHLNDAEVKAIAHDLDVEPGHVRQMEERLTSWDEAYDAPAADDDDAFFSPSRYLEQDGADPASIVELEDDEAASQQFLKGAFESLDERAREIISRRWLSEHKSTLHELAERFNISAERVRQLEQNALAKLRRQIES